MAEIRAHRSPFRSRLLVQLLVAVLVAACLSVVVGALLAYRSTSSALQTIEQARARENRTSGLRLLAQRGDQQLALVGSWTIDSRTEAAARRRETAWFITNAAHKLVGVGGITALKVYDPDGLMIASSGELVVSTDLWHSKPARSARNGVPSVGIVSNLGSLWIVAAAPIFGADLAPPSRGVLIGLSPIDSRVALALSGGSGDGIAIVAGPRVVAASGSEVAAEVTAALDGQSPRADEIARGAASDLSFAPLRDEESPFFGADQDAFIVVATSRKVFDEARQHLFRDTLTALVIALAIAVVTAGLLSRRIVDPLRSLLEDLRATGEGDLGRIAPVRGHDEIADLTRAFNRMSQKLAAMRDALRGAATRDSATGLLNHAEFFRRLNGELARADREERTVSMLMIDIDGFKQINDARGHLVGDAILLRVARLVVSHARESDVIARYGGDEFAIVLLGVEAEEAVGIADRLRGSAACPTDPFDAALVPCRLSIGVATRGPWGATARQLVEAADHALLAAKRRGRDRVVLGRSLERPPRRPTGTSV